MPIEIDHDDEMLCSNFLPLSYLLNFKEQLVGRCCWNVGRSGKRQWAAFSHKTIMG
jgi:hypothetical protein